MASLSAKMCGCRVLNAEEKSADSSLAVVLGSSRWLCTISMMLLHHRPLCLHNTQTGGGPSVGQLA